MKLVYSVSEVCEQLGGICPRMFYLMVKRGQIRITKIGRRTVVLRDDLEAAVLKLSEQKKAA